MEGLEIYIHKDGSSPSDSVTTGPDGTFELAVPPGAHWVGMTNLDEFEVELPPEDSVLIVFGQNGLPVLDLGSQHFPPAALLSTGVTEDVVADRMGAGPMLSHSRPNPASPDATISFTLSRASHVSLRVFDARGREIAVLLDEDRNSGRHDIVFEGGDLNSGVYFYRLKVGDIVETGELILLR